MNCPRNSRTIMRDPNRPGKYLMGGHPYELRHLPDKKTLNFSKYSPQKNLKEENT